MLGSSRTAFLLHAAKQPVALTGTGSGGWLCEQSSDCQAESLYVVLLLGSLIAAIVAILTAFAFFREDREEQITPLCPQMVVREPELGIRLPLGDDTNDVVITDHAGVKRGTLIIDWPDPFRNEARGGGVVATVRLQSENDVTLATVVANMSTQGLGLALHRGTGEFFGIVKAEPPRRYHVRHRTGVHLLTLVGDFASLDLEGLNPVGSKVCSFKSVDQECTGRVLQHVDAGLALCSLMAMYVHRKLTFALAAAAAPQAALPTTCPVQMVSDAADAAADAARAAAADAGVEQTNDEGGNEAIAQPIFRGAEPAGEQQISPAKTPSATSEERAAAPRGLPQMAASPGSPGSPGWPSSPESQVQEQRAGPQPPPAA